ncbi:hypothetical protein [Thermococcus sp.]|uniref:hypothetical protein n=1 Tax=Thermococcus sp. TaxID=35749 RepID=UPI0025E97685|nr:hypothetical protein [Thermococcus sp.]
MGALEKIKKFLKARTVEEIKSFEDVLVKRYGFKKYLYTTSEGLPVMGNFEGYEELSAKAPELFKALSGLESANKYWISGEKGSYLLIKITPDVLLLAETSKKLSVDEIDELVKRTKKELGL